MTAPDDVRARFEAWLTKRHGLSTERWADSGNYKYGDTRAWWECWQAAHADLAGEVREFLDAQPLAAKNDARRVWQILEDAGVDTAALDKFAHQEPRA